MVLAPSPGIGDFIVRIPAIRLLAGYFRVTVVCPLPPSMRRFAELVLQEPAVNLDGHLGALLQRGHSLRDCPAAR